MNSWPIQVNVPNAIVEQPTASVLHQQWSSKEAGPAL